MSNYNDLLKQLGKYTQLFEELTVTQNRKAEAVRQYDMEELTACMNKEQADALLIRGYDKKRLKMQEELSIGDKGFQEILPLFPAELQPECNQVFRQLGDAYTTYSAAANTARQLIEINIYRLNNAVTQLKATTGADTGEFYTPDGSIPSERLTFRDMKI